MEKAVSGCFKEVWHIREKENLPFICTIHIDRFMWCSTFVMELVVFAVGATSISSLKDNSEIISF